MIHAVRVLVAVLLLAAGQHPAQAQQRAPHAGAVDARLDEPRLEERQAPRTLDEPIPGVVVDQTVTLIGHRFLQHFATAWADLPQIPARYILTIYERPSARWGSLVWIEYDHTRVYRIFLHPRSADIGPIAETAARSVWDQLSQLEVQKFLFTDPDLGKDEF